MPVSFFNLIHQHPEFKPRIQTGPREYVEREESAKYTSFNKDSLALLLKALDEFSNAQQAIKDNLNRAHKKNASPNNKLYLILASERALEANLKVFKEKLAGMLFRPESHYRDLYFAMYLLIREQYLGAHLIYNHDEWKRKVVPYIERLNNIEVALLANFVVVMGKRIIKPIQLLYLLSLSEILKSRESEKTHDMHGDLSTAVKLYNSAVNLLHVTQGARTKKPAPVMPVRPPNFLPSFGRQLCLGFSVGVTLCLALSTATTPAAISNVYFKPG